MNDQEEYQREGVEEGIDGQASSLQFDGLVASNQVDVRPRTARDISNSLGPVWQLSRPTGLLKQVTKVRHQIEELMSDNRDPSSREAILALFKIYHTKANAFMDNCNAQIDVYPIPSSSAVEDFRLWFAPHSSEIGNFINDVEHWLEANGDNPGDGEPVADEIEPHDSASQTSDTSQRTSSSLHRRLLEEKIKNDMKAKLQKEQLLLEQREVEERQQFERNQLEYRKMKIKLETDFKKREIEQMEEQLSQLSIRSQRSINKSRGSARPKKNYSESFENNAPPPDAFRLPQHEPEKFSGLDITIYKTFILTFEKMIADRCSNYEDKYYYLLRYTAGEANQLVSSCHDTDSRTGYKEARRLLDIYYGNEYRLAEKYLEKLSRWETIKSEDHVALSKFAMYLNTVRKMMTSMGPLTQLNSWRDISELMLKLPYDLRKQFRKQVSNIIQRNEVVNFGVFVEFVSSQAEVMSIPLFGNIRNDINGDEEHTNRTHTFFVSENETSNPKPASNYCPCCKKSNHSLNDCYFFLKKSMKMREDFVRENKLCFACFSNSHFSRECPSKLVCNICDKNHPSSLHTTFNARTEDVKPLVQQEASMATMKTGQVYCPTIPVSLRSVDGTKTINTYLGLDSHSTASYMDKNLAERLGLSGKQTVLSIITLENEISSVKTESIENVLVSSLDGSGSVIIPKVYSKEQWPFKREQCIKPSHVRKFGEFDDIPFTFIDEKIGILVGLDMPELIKPQEIINPTKNGPYASRHVIGWALNGPINGNSDTIETACMKTTVRDINEIDYKLEHLFGRDFDDNNAKDKFSVKEKTWIKNINENTIKLDSGNFQVKLPFVNEKIILPDNRKQVYYRLLQLKRKLMNDEAYYDEYSNFMTTMIERNFAEKIPPEEFEAPRGKCWYLTHHGVRHKQSGKLRIVFDCSLEYMGTSLNKILEKGPDLSNALVGILLKFRLEHVAVCGDIEKMFYMIKTDTYDSNFLRFLWYERGLDGEPTHYRLKVHVFGATSSPAIANNSLKKTAENVTDEQVKNTILGSFYVDDMMSSFPDEKTALRVLSSVQDTLRDSGFNLTGISSNSREVLKNVNKEKLSKQLQAINIDSQNLPFERTLGVKWNPENDSFSYKLNIGEQPSTKRGVLSTIFSIYDPLSLASPVIIRAKRVFQICCEMKISWDEPLPQTVQVIWDRWRSQIPHLKNVEIPRCYKSLEGEMKSIQLHVFCDGSEIGYGAVAYIRYEDQKGQIETSVVMAKARLTPINRGSLKTVPRIELNSAQVAVELFEQIKAELMNDVNVDEIFFWTDSMSNLRYINSQTARFHKFVSNRVAYILNSMTAAMWNHVPGDSNPADLLSRGIGNVENFGESDIWFRGPEFLLQPHEKWPRTAESTEISEYDSELKTKTFSYRTENNGDCFYDLIHSTSSLSKLKTRIAIINKFIDYIGKKTVTKKISCEDLRRSERLIWKFVQKTEFSNEYEQLNSDGELKRKHFLNKLSPFIDEEGLMRSGGRLKNAPLPYDTKCPVILHGNSYPVQLFIKEIHSYCGHLGKPTVLSIIRNK